MNIDAPTVLAIIGGLTSLGGAAVAVYTLREVKRAKAAEAGKLEADAAAVVLAADGSLAETYGRLLRQAHDDLIASRGDLDGEIARRRELEGRLAEAEARLAQLELRIAASEHYEGHYEDGPGFRCSVDVRTRRVVYCSRSMARVLGYTKRELIGRDLLELYEPTSHAVVEAAFERLVRGGILDGVPVELRTSDGAAVSLLLYARAVEGAGELTRSYSLLVPTPAGAP